MNSILRRRRAAMSGQRSTFWLNAAKYFQIGSDISTNAKAAQGACFATSGTYSYVYFVVITADEATQYLYTTTISSGITTLRATYNTLGHANSLTCDQENGVIYVATMDTAVGIKKINAETYAEIGSFQIHNADGDAVLPWAIAFDRKKRLLYSWNNTKFYVYQPDGTFVREIQRTNIPTHEGATAQTLETDGEYIYTCYAKPNLMDVYTMDGTYLRTISIGTSNEMEEPVYDWNGGWLYTEYVSSGKQRLYSLLFRSYDGMLRLSYVIPGAWTYLQDTGTIGKYGYFSFNMSSTAAKAYKITAKAIGYPYGMDFLRGKKCRLSFNILRKSGSAGQVYINIFTSNTDSVTDGNDRLYYNTYTVTIPTSGEEDIVFEFVPGESWFVPTAGNDGNYVGFWIMLYADSGNGCYVRNFKFEVEV